MSAKTVDAALFELALVCAVPGSPCAEIFVAAGLKMLTPAHFALCREVTAYAVGRLWLRVKGQMPNSEQESRISTLAGNVGRILMHHMKNEGFDSNQAEAQTDSDMEYSLTRASEYSKGRRDEKLLLRELQNGLGAATALALEPSTVSLLANAYESLFDSWASENPNVFVPAALGSLDISKLPGLSAMSFRQAVDICGDFGELYADLNDKGVLFKPETRLPASRESVKLALKLSRACDSNMSQQLRQAHDYMYGQLALFVPESDAERARSITQRPYVEVISGREMPSAHPVKFASVRFGNLHLMGQEQFMEALSWFGDEFYNSPYFDGRESTDSSFMRALALRCWTEMWTLAKDWREFVNSHGL